MFPGKRLCGLIRQILHLSRHNGKSPSGFPCPRRFDSRIQRQKIRLRRNILNGSDNRQILEEDVTQMRGMRERIEDVSSVVDNNSATSQETAAVSEEQKAQVEIMVGRMDQFQI